MDDLVLINLVRNISIVASIIGLLVGFDLILGARIESTLRKVMDRVMINMDKKISSTRGRIIAGGLFVLISGLMILLIVYTKN